jgi:DNA-binding transcriptional regulator YhcF (GntR family)
MEGDLLMKKKVPTEKEIAKKHGVSVETIIKQAEVGSTVEREHVTTHEEAYGIALQHLDEFPDYYTHLLKMEKELKAQHKKKRTVKEMRQICENHVAVAMGKEIDDEGGMIMSQLDTIENAVTRLRTVVGDPKMQLPGWVQSKVTLACDYIDTAADYMTSKNESVEVSESAWTRKEGQNKNGGLNEKGRKSYERENPGSDLKAPSKKVGNPRRASFCARMKGMRKRQKDKNNTGEDRLSKSLRAWNC